MSDPAVEAARRAYRPPVHRYDEITWRELESAAREALKPIRELHKPEVIKVISCPLECEIHEDDCPANADFTVCAECYRFAEDDMGVYFDDGGTEITSVEWPCATARLVYSAEELS